MGGIKNIPLKDFRSFLLEKGLKEVKCKSGGHEKWTRHDLGRPVIIQSHIEPIPEFIVKNILTTIGSTKQELMKFLGRN